ncbi:MAG: hypothetical protein AABW67_02050 [Nanoarchaeota archaeon]
MEKCARCGVDGERIRLFDVIYEGEIANLCERCSIIENVTVIKKPSSSQLEEAERGEGVYKRMKRLAGITEKKPDKTFFVQDRLKELDSRPELELPEKNRLNLIEHFHWEIMRNRRRKGYTQEKLSETLSESLIVLQMLERGKLPENADRVLKKIEQLFQISLRKIGDRERMMQDGGIRRSPVLLNQQGEELDIIPEEEIERLEEDFEEPIERENLKGVDFEKGELDLSTANLSRVRISDLKVLNKKKVEATKQEKFEEAKRIEQRQKLVEARKEELRASKERESKELDKFLGGDELLKEDEVEVEEEEI